MKNTSLKDAAESPSPKDEIVVFQVVRDSECAECGEVLGKGRLLRMEGNKPLCCTCADLGHLVILPRGNMALTRRAKKYSTLWAVVIRFSRLRGRYERQGLLVEEEALAKAEQECLSDAEARALARERAAGRREELDMEYVDSFALRIGELFPGCPESERREIAEHACKKHSDRVGRSAAARDLEEEPVSLAVRAHIRHEHTPYDELLGGGISREEARRRVAALVESHLEQWKRGKA